MSSVKLITRKVWLLSLVSLFTDFASEMLYPVMPVYLKTVGYSVLFIGVLEGFAEAIAGLSKSYFGRWSDASGKRLPFVQWGYTLSAVSKPLLALSAHWLVIFSSRFIDRTGKGIRTAPRDAMLNAETTDGKKATVFGFHRMMDTFGAVTGPLLTLLYLYFFPGNYQTLFLLAFIPGAVAVFITLLLKEKRITTPPKGAPPFHQIFAYWKHSSAPYKKLITVLLLFAVINSSDMFLLLKMKESGVQDTLLIGVYIFYNLVYALFAYPLGRMADKLGMKTIFAAGLILYAFTYAGFAVSNSVLFFVIFFFTYGLYAAATEGVAKAWISSLVPKEENASAIGFYTGLQSFAAFLASSLTGVFWLAGSPVLVFAIAASVAFLLALLLLMVKKL